MQYDFMLWFAIYHSFLVFIMKIMLVINPYKSVLVKVKQVKLHFEKLLNVMEEKISYFHWILYDFFYIWFLHIFTFKSINRVKKTNN